MKKMALIIPLEIEEFHLYKDVGEVPYYLSKNYNVECEIVHLGNGLSGNFRSVKLIPRKGFMSKLRKIPGLGGIFYSIRLLTYLIKHAKKIDVLMLFHFSKFNFLAVILYKLMNSKGKIYNKLDLDPCNIEQKNNKITVKKYINFVDLFSVETLVAYEKIKHNFHGFDIDDKLLYLPNGFDEDLIAENEIEINDFKDKENLIITVGRLGAHEKITEMILRAIETLDLKDWKVALVGPICNGFEKVIEEFYIKYPEKKSTVIFMDNITDKKILMDYYNRAKVFLLTSRRESFGIVLNEALYFGNYIITTNVGAAIDITNNGQFGTVIKNNNSEDLKQVLTLVINEEINLETEYNKAIQHSNQYFVWENLCKNKSFEQLFE